MNPTTDNMVSGEVSDARYEVEVREEFSKIYQKMWMKVQKITKKHYNKRRKVQSFEED